MHELIWCTPFSGNGEGKSVHWSINKQLGQYQSIRNEGEKLVHVVKIQELLNTADRSLAKVTPRPKCESCNVYLQKIIYSEGQKKVT